MVCTVQTQGSSILKAWQHQSGAREELSARCCIFPRLCRLCPVWCWGACHGLRSSASGHIYMGQEAGRRKPGFLNFSGQFSSTGCGCPIPGGTRGQAAWGPGQPGLVGDNSSLDWNWVIFYDLSYSNFSMTLFDVLCPAGKTCRETSRWQWAGRSSTWIPRRYWGLAPGSAGCAAHCGLGAEPSRARNREWNGGWKHDPKQCLLLCSRASSS